MRSRRRIALALLSAAALLAPQHAARGQLTDLQPGKNFTKFANFGTGDHSECIDVGDIDGDGDLDVIVANGGDGGNELNRLFVNKGGLQGGTVGTFADETATRLPGEVADDSRGCNFVDIDNDGDLDLFIANSGNAAVPAGQPSRFYVNLGGLQGGTPGVFQEQTNARWGTLVSVPAGQQILGGNHGPFTDWCYDAAFADLNDDGFTDLFFSSSGPNLNGASDSRVFLNDGTGVFNELWPWANPAADTKVPTTDVELGDLDGDFDIDVVMSNLGGQARTFMNNLDNGFSASPFQDITKAAFIDTGAVTIGNANYATEMGDLNGDGNFDLWMVSYDGNLDRVLVNNGFTPGVGYTFSAKPAWVTGDLNTDENDVDFGDFDGDGDLDVFVTNFSGTSSLYQSGLAQGLNPDTQGLFHNTGVAASGDLAANFPEGAPSFNAGQSLGGVFADLDNDGDEDILIANDADQQNREYVNSKGKPDTHAPSIFKLQQQAAKANGSSSAIHVAVRDNSEAYLVNFYPTVLKYRVNNGSEQSLAMFHQGGMQFRGVIPAQTDAFVVYRVECTDLAGNTGLSPQLWFQQGNPPAFGAWTHLGSGLAGSGGIPVLNGTGSQLAGLPVSINLTGAKPNAPALLFVSLAKTPTPFKGGTLLTVPVLMATPFASTGGAGTIALPFAWSKGVPAAFSIYYQYGIQDAGAPKGVALSTALQSTAP